MPGIGSAIESIVPGGIMSDETEFAGIGRRIPALLVDLVVFCAVFFPVTRLVKGAWVMGVADHRWHSGWFVTDPLCIGFLVVMFFYFVFLEGLTGFTLGKLALGLKVVRPGGGLPGPARGFLRNMLRIVDGLPVLGIVGIVLIVTSAERTRFGDRVAGTRVIRVGRT